MDRMGEEEPIVAELYRERWRPSPGWSDVVRPAHQALRGGATGLAAADAWAELAMMLGDTRAAPLPLGRMGDPELVRIAAPALAAWLERQLAPFGGDLAAAAAFALDLAAERTGLTTP